MKTQKKGIRSANKIWIGYVTLEIESFSGNPGCWFFMDNFGNATSLGGEVEKVFPLTETLPQVLREAANALARWTLRVTGVAATPKEFSFS